MGKRDDVWYATNIEIYDYVQAYRSLLWSARGDRVYNPSAVPVFFKIHGSHRDQGKLFRVDPGKDTVIE